jgi:hypothetical protein
MATRRRGRKARAHLADIAAQLGVRHVRAGRHRHAGDVARRRLRRLDVLRAGGGGRAKQGERSERRKLLIS